MRSEKETMCNLFIDTAKYVSEKGVYEFNQEEADNCLLFLNKVKTLGADADSLYTHLTITVHWYMHRGGSKKTSLSRHFLMTYGTTAGSTFRTRISHLFL